MAELAVVLRNRLLGDSTISGLIGTRIYPTTLPDDVTFPAMTYRRISGTTQSGSTRLRTPRFQLDCWADTPLQAMTLASAARARLEGWGDGQVLMARVSNEWDDYEPDRQRYRQLLDVLITGFEQQG